MYFLQICNTSTVHYTCIYLHLQYMCTPITGTSIQLYIIKILYTSSNIFFLIILTCTYLLYIE